MFFFGTRIHPHDDCGKSFFLSQHDPNLQDPSKDELFRSKIYACLEKFAELADDDGPFFLGSDFSFADAMLIPFWHRFRYSLPGLRGFNIIPKIGEPGYAHWAPRLEQWADAVSKRDSFLKTTTEAVDGFGEKDPSAMLGLNGDNGGRFYGGDGYGGARGKSEFGKPGVGRAASRGNSPALRAKR